MAVVWRWYLNHALWHSAVVRLAAARRRMTRSSLGSDVDGAIASASATHVSIVCTSPSRRNPMKKVGRAPRHSVPPVEIEQRFAVWIPSPASPRIVVLCHGAHPLAHTLEAPPVRS